MNKIPKLFKLMQIRGVSSYQIAKATGISTGNISDWKNGKCGPSKKAINQLAEYFSVPPEYFFSEDNEDDVFGNIEVTEAYKTLPLKEKLEIQLLILQKASEHNGKSS